VSTASASLGRPRAPLVLARCPASAYLSCHSSYRQPVLQCHYKRPASLIPVCILPMCHDGLGPSPNHSQPLAAPDHARVDPRPVAILACTPSRRCSCAARLALTHADATSLSSFSSNRIHLHHVSKVLLTFYSTGKCSTSISQLIA
jgi:hypothetical protein